MRRITFVVVVLAAILASYELGRYHRNPEAGSGEGRRVLYYVDPMHPSYKSDKPGIAPDCGMKLEPVYSGGVADAASTASLSELPAGTVNIDGAAQRLLGIRVAAVEKNGAARTIRVVGRVVPEDTRVFKVNSGVDGFIRQTYNDSVGTQVAKDQKLATYYSPEFLAVSSGYLAAVERVPGSVGGDGSRTVPFPGAVSKQGVSSLQGYTDRLRNLGMSDVQIKHMADSHQLPESIDVYAPAAGFILARNISPGQHFEHNMDFYRIADLSRVWVAAEIYEQEAGLLRPGGVARVTLRGEARQFPARITDSLPQSEAGGGTVKLRLEVENPGFLLRPEMLVDVELPVRLPQAVTVPVDALIDSGASARVYVERGEGIFEPREVETGWRDGDRVEVRSGLRSGERVVVAATFLVDSESRMKAPEAAAAPSRHASVAPTRDPRCGMPVDPAKAKAAGNTLAYRGATYYFCSKKCKEAFQAQASNSTGRREGADD